MTILCRSTFFLAISAASLLSNSLSVSALDNSASQGTIDAPIQLEKGVAKENLSGLQNNVAYFTLPITADARNLSVRIAGGNGDADLYLRYNQPPTTSEYDCRPFIFGNNEACNIENAVAGNYYVMVRGYSSYTNLRLIADFDDGSIPDTTSTPTPPSNDNIASASCMNASQQELLTAHNAARAQARNCGGQTFAAAAPLQWSCPLSEAATNHSTDMATNNFFSHTGSNGLSLSNRLSVVGYNPQIWGENIAAGQTSVNQVMQGWLNSPGHCSNIMNPSMSEIGAARVESTTSGISPYWTTVLAKPQ